MLTMITLDPVRFGLGRGFSEAVLENGERRNDFLTIVDLLSSDDTSRAANPLNELLRCLTPLARSQLTRESATRRERVVERAAAFLRGTTTRIVPLQELAAIVGVAIPHLVQWFRLQIGLTPHQYHLHVRIDATRRLIARGLPAAEVAAAAGFVDVSHFHRHFRRITGCTPGYYRDACW